MKEHLILRDLQEFEQSLNQESERQIQLCNAVKRISNLHIDKLPPGSKRGTDDFSKVVRVVCYPCVEGAQQEYEAIVGVRESDTDIDRYYLL